RTGKERGAAIVLDELDALATQLESDAGAARGRDAVRLRSLAATIKGRTAKLRGSSLWKDRTRHPSSVRTLSVRLEPDTAYASVSSVDEGPEARSGPFGECDRS